jgi:hypothetical protein
MSMSISGSVSSAVSSALQGLNTSVANFNQDAQAIAGSVDGGDVTGAMIDASQQNVMAQMNAQVLAMSEKTLGSLLDVLA